MLKTTITAALCLAAHATNAQDLTHKTASQEHPVFLTGGTVHTVSGEVIPNGAVGFSGGTITFVGASSAMARAEIPEGSRVIDVTGKHVFPGMFASSTSLGLNEISTVRAMRDSSEVGSMTPEVYAAVAVNPDSTFIPVTRSNGVLVFGSFPGGGTVPGRASVMVADGWTWEDMTVEPHAGLIVNWPNVSDRYSAFGGGGGGRFGGGSGGSNGQDTIDRIDDLFDAAEDYAAARAGNPDHPADLGLEAVATTLAGADQTPVFINANGYNEIVSAVTWAAERGLDPVIFGARDAPLAAELLKTHDVPVIISGSYGFPRRDDSAHDEPYTLAQRLGELGVRYAMNTSSGGPHVRNLPYDAGRAIGYGLDPADALAAVTLWPAQIMGVGDVLGSLDEGKSATLIVTDGHCLDIMTTVEMAFVHGREIDLSNKQTKLRDKYRDKYKQLGIIEED